jgi:fatty acid desaturase
MTSAEAAVGRRTRPAEDDYRELKARIVSAGLLERQPRYYIAKTVFTLALYAAVPCILLLSQNLWVVLADAGLAAFALGQMGLLGHDVGHRQSNGPGRLNDAMALLIAPVLLGFAGAWWRDKHNRHHSNPNVLERDPDIGIASISFTPEQALEKTGAIRWLNRYQAFLFFPALLFEGIHLRLESIKYLARNRTRFRRTELVLIALSTTASVWFVVAVLGPWTALIFVAVSQGLYGLYLGSIFAPNHKGMPILERDDELDFFRRQVITARNVYANPFYDFWYGGLNYQIEHHLFPNMPRNKLREAQKIVRAFCAERDVPYYETGMLRSYREVLVALHTSSAPLREIFEY